MQSIVHQEDANCTVCLDENHVDAIEAALRLNSNAKAHPAFERQSLIPELARNGFVILPELTKWLVFLAPENQAEAWQAFKNLDVIQKIRTHPSQLRRCYFNEFRQPNDLTHIPVNFETAPKQSSLTIIEGPDNISRCLSLPNAVRSYLALAYEFIRTTKEILTEKLPKATVPFISRAQFSEFQEIDSSDKLIACESDRVPDSRFCNRSVLTLLLGRADGLLYFKSKGKWHRAANPQKSPSAVLFPGLGARQIYNLQSTPYFTLPSSRKRFSVAFTIFPALPKEGLAS